MINFVAVHTLCDNVPSCIRDHFAFLIFEIWIWSNMYKSHSFCFHNFTFCRISSTSHRWSPNFWMPRSLSNGMAIDKYLVMNLQSNLKTEPLINFPKMSFSQLNRVVFKLKFMNNWGQIPGIDIKTDPLTNFYKISFSQRNMETKNPFLFRKAEG